jgi:hypothetical protein
VRPWLPELSTAACRTVSGLLFWRASANKHKHLRGFRSTELALTFHVSREQLPPSDKSMLTIILEAPALPLPSLFAFLRELCDEKGDWPTLALTTARTLIALRPAARQGALNFILQSAISLDPDIRCGPIPLYIAWVLSTVSTALRAHM